MTGFAKQSQENKYFLFHRYNDIALLVSALVLYWESSLVSNPYALAFFVLSLSAVVLQNQIGSMIWCWRRPIYGYLFAQAALLAMIATKGELKIMSVGAFAPILVWAYYSSLTDRNATSLTHISRNRLFFHDLVNQTHALKLFLNQRVEQQRALSSEEIEVVVHEIETAEKIMVHHFGYGHKNIEERNQLISFDRFWSYVQPLAYSYFPNDMKFSLFFHGRLAQGVSYQERERCRVHLPTLSRIVLNLFKNIGEAGSEAVEVHFDYDLNGLKLTVKNSLPQTFHSDDYKNFEEKILQMPLGEYRDESVLEKGLGLLSVSDLCKQANGEFSFYIDEKALTWNTELYLPEPSESVVEKNLPQAA